MKKTLLVVAALEDELSGLRAAFGSDARVQLLKTGMGAKRMQQALQQACEEASPDFILHLGFCGALQASFKSGDLIFSRQIMHAGGKCVEITTPELETATAICKQFWLSFHEGKTLQVEKLISLAQEKKQLHEHFNALSVDMESFALADFCVQENIPFFVVRSVFDTARHTLPHFGCALDVFGKVRPLHFVKHLLFHPRDFFLLPQLAFCARKAKLSLNLFTQEWIQLWLQKNDS